MAEASITCPCGAAVTLAVEERYTYRACVRCRLVTGDAKACVMCNTDTVQMPESSHLTGACGICGLAFDLITPPPVYVAG